MFAVVHCPDFYLQCERIFRPALATRGLALVSSGGDSGHRVVASSRLARTHGIVPNLGDKEVADIVASIPTEKSVHMCSPNYELYANLHSRFIKSLELLAPSVVANACDEAILNLHGIKTDRELRTYGVDIKENLKKWLGVSAFVGIAPTKALAKLACNAAQELTEFGGVIELCDISHRQSILNRVSVSEIPGISKKAAAKLNTINIHTALEMSMASKIQIRRHCSIVIERIALELSGIECAAPAAYFDHENTRSTMASGMSKHDIIALKRELNSQVAKAQGELIDIAKACTTICLSLTTPALNPNDPPFENTLSADLSKPTSSTSTIRRLAGQLLESLWQEERQYHSLKLSLGDLSPIQSKQCALFVNQNHALSTHSKNQKSQTIGYETVLSATSIGVWRQRKLVLSPCFTTQWGDLPRVS